MESACPLWWGSEFGLTEANTRMNSNAAGGHRVERYGQRSVVVESGFERLQASL